MIHACFALIRSVPAKKKSSNVRSRKIYDDSDKDDDDELSDFVDFEVMKRSTPKPTRNRKQISYAVDSDSDEDSADAFGKFVFSINLLFVTWHLIFTIFLAEEDDDSNFE
jgi:hypothetical protein